MGDLPNAYVYAANNPSESIIAKRRGYGTIVSHNVPPYGRCARRRSPAPAAGLPSARRAAAHCVRHCASPTHLDDMSLFSACCGALSERYAHQAGRPSAQTSTHIAMAQSWAQASDVQSQQGLAPSCAGRAGLYKQLAELRALVTEFREDPAAGEGLKARPARLSAPGWPAGAPGGRGTRAAPAPLDAPCCAERNQAVPRACAGPALAVEPDACAAACKLGASCNIASPVRAHWAAATGGT